MTAETRIALERCRVLQRGPSCRTRRVRNPVQRGIGVSTPFTACTPPPPDGRASRPAIRAASTLASGELEENLECEGEGAAAVDEVARLAEIGL